MTDGRHNEGQTALSEAVINRQMQGDQPVEVLAFWRDGYGEIRGVVSEAVMTFLDHLQHLEQPPPALLLLTLECLHR